MKKTIAGIIFAAVFLFVQAGRADDTKSIAATAPTPYPLDYCVVSGDKLGTMGTPIEYIYQDKAKGIDQEIKFCCPDCKPQFLKDPDKFMAIIQKAETAGTNSTPAGK